MYFADNLVSWDLVSIFHSAIFHTALLTIIFPALLCCLLMNIVDTHTKSDIRLQLCHRLYIVDPLQGEAWAYGTFLPQLPVNVSWSVILSWLCDT